MRTVKYLFKHIYAYVNLTIFFAHLLACLHKKLCVTIYLFICDLFVDTYRYLVFQQAHSN